MKNHMDVKDWQIWGKKPEQLITLEQRARGILPEMESTKQLVKIISESYRSNMSVLDVGCNAGHYLVGLKRLDPKINYTGFDAYESYINKAREIFSDDNVKFEVHDITSLNFPDSKYDIVFCCNVFLHLPDFRIALKNLLSVTKSTCIIRTLLGTSTTIVKLSYDEKFDENGNPTNYCYLNTWKLSTMVNFIQNLGWNVKIIDDEFNPNTLQTEFEKVKEKSGTRIFENHQVDSNIIFDWKWLKITK